MRVEHTENFVRIQHPNHELVNATMSFMKTAESKNMLYVNNDDFQQVVYEKFGDDIVVIFSYEKSKDKKVLTFRKR